MRVSNLDLGVALSAQSIICEDSIMSGPAYTLHIMTLPYANSHYFPFFSGLMRDLQQLFYTYMLCIADFQNLALDPTKQGNLSLYCYAHMSPARN